MALALRAVGVDDKINARLYAGKKLSAFSPIKRRQGIFFFL
jgi:hypothetical protein